MSRGFPFCCGFKPLVSSLPNVCLFLRFTSSPYTFKLFNINWNPQTQISHKDFYSYIKPYLETTNAQIMSTCWISPGIKLHFGDRKLKWFFFSSYNWSALKIWWKYIVHSICFIKSNSPSNLTSIRNWQII